MTLPGQGRRVAQQETDFLLAGWKPKQEEYISWRGGYMHGGECAWRRYTHFFMSLQIPTHTLESVNQGTRFRKMGGHCAFTDNDAPEVLAVNDARARKPIVAFSNAAV